MKIKHIIFIWLLTAFTGTLLTSFLTQLYLAHFIKFDNILFYTIVWSIPAFILSIAFSMPTITVLIIASEYFKTKNIPSQQYKKRLLLLQLICSVITFSILTALNAGAERIYFVFCFLGYTSIGVYLWNRKLNKIKTEIE